MKNLSFRSILMKTSSIVKWFVLPVAALVILLLVIHGCKSTPSQQLARPECKTADVKTESVSQRTAPSPLACRRSNANQVGVTVTAGGAAETKYPAPLACRRSNIDQDGAPVAAGSAAKAKCISTNKALHAKFGNQLFLDGLVSENRAVLPPGAVPGPGPRDFNTEEYKYIEESDFLPVSHNPLSTFSVDVDTASYANVRRYLLQNNLLPPKDALRIEECLNYFTYDYPAPADAMPLRPTMELGDCPWNAKHDLLLIGLQAKKIDKEKLPPSNFVFLIDTSGSMSHVLPMVQQSMVMLAKQMRPCDRIAIVTYAGSAGLVLPSTPGDCQQLIADKINQLRSGGCTAGSAGIKLAYETAAEYFIKNGNNRVVLITDGDFNVGVSNEGDLVRMIEQERARNIFLTVLGVGSWNVKDNKMQMLADKGNGNYHYLDSLREAQKVLVNEMSGNMFTLAKDVKIQIEFNPRFVKAYRLIGYEKRKLADRDFADDTKDAGEVGVGHQVTALYEIIPASSNEKVDAPAPLEFQKTTIVSDKYLNFRLRWKAPDADKSTEWVGYCSSDKTMKTSDNFRFAAAVAEFGLLLRESKYKGSGNWEQAVDLAKSAKGKDDNGNRAEFIRMAEAAQLLQNRK